MSNLLSLPRTRITVFFLTTTFVLLTNHFVLQVLHYQYGRGHWILRDLFDVDQEENFPTAYSAFALLSCAGVLALITAAKRANKDRYATHWHMLSLGFGLLALDEVAGIHEAVNTVIDIPWTIPGAIGVLMIGAAYLRFLMHLPGRFRIGLICAALLFVGGSVAVEHAGDWYLETYDQDSLGYKLLTGLEEGLEMAGVVLFINIFLGYLQQENREGVILVVK